MVRLFPRRHQPPGLARLGPPSSRTVRSDGVPWRLHGHVSAIVLASVAVVPADTHIHVPSRWQGRRCLRCCLHLRRCRGARRWRLHVCIQFAPPLPRPTRTRRRQPTPLKQQSPPPPPCRSARLSVAQALTRKFRLGTDVNLETIVRSCPPTFTGADMYGVCSSALSSAIRRLAFRYEEVVRAESAAGGTTPSMSAFLSGLSEDQLTPEVRGMRVSVTSLLWRVGPAADVPCVVWRRCRPLTSWKQSRASRRLCRRRSSRHTRRCGASTAAAARSRAACIVCVHVGGGHRH